MSIGWIEGIPERNSSEWICWFWWIVEGGIGFSFDSHFYTVNRLKTLRMDAKGRVRGKVRVGGKTFKIGV
jgi:hypothetical protein